MNNLDELNTYCEKHRLPYYIEQDKDDLIIISKNSNEILYDNSNIESIRSWLKGMTNKD